MQIGQIGLFQSGATGINEPTEVHASKIGPAAEALGSGLPQDTTSFSTASTADSGSTAAAPVSRLLVQQSMASSPARGVRVEGLRQSVAAGSYKLDAGSITDAILRTTV